MDSFRGLGDLPVRMGFTGPTGGIVMGLPYAEGQLLATLTDDWRRIRLEPQLLTWGARGSQALVAGQFNIQAFSAGRLAARIIYLSTIGTTGNVVVSRTTITGLVAASTAPIVPLEAPTNLTVGGVSTVAAANLILFPSQVAQFLNAAGFALPTGTQNWNGCIFPRLLLPGEFLVFQSVAGSPLEIMIAWEQLPSLIDVLTSRAEPVEPQIGP